MGRMGSSTRKPPLAKGAITLVIMACAIYSVSLFLRNSVGVIAPDLTNELGLTPDELGLLSGVFFFSFALAQLPIGIALDRYGPRICIVALIGLAVAGCVVFANSYSAVSLVVARIIMGLGCAVLFMGPLLLFSRWFAPQQFATFVGLLMSVGNIGTLAATAPLAWMSGQFGWRGAFLLVAGIAVVIGLIAAIIVRDAPPGEAFHPKERESFLDSLRGMRSAFHVKDLWPLMVMHFFCYGAFATLLGLWGGPYLSDIHGLDLEQRGTALLVLAAGQVLGLLIWGPMDRLFDSRKNPVIIAVLLSGVSLGALSFWPMPSKNIVLILFAAFGFLSGFTPLVIAHGRHLYPRHLVGRGLTLLNMATMSGVFIMQIVTGYIIAGFDPIVDASGIKHNSPAAYQACFGFMMVTMFVSLVIYVRAGDRKPSND